jgi:uncharacterized membrane protein YbhN (UPF0104 family)
VTTRTRTAGRILLQLLLSAAFVAVLVWRGDFGGSLVALRTARWGFIAPAIVLVALSNVMHGIRWWLLLRRAGTVPVRDTILVLIAATGLGLVLPFRTGAALQLQVVRRRYGIDRVVVVGTLIGEGLVDAAMFVLLALVAVPLLGLDNRILVVAVLLAVLAGSLALSVVLLGGRSRRWLLPLPDRARILVEDIATSLALGLNALGNPRSAALLVIPTIGDWTLMTGAHWLAGHAVGLYAPVYAFLAVEIVANVATTVPLTQLNVGPYEVAARETMAAFGADPRHATAFAIATHLSVIVAAALSGLAAAWMLHLRREDIFYVRGGDQQV